MSKGVAVDPRRLLRRVARRSLSVLTRGGAAGARRSRQSPVREFSLALPGSDERRAPRSLQITAPSSLYVPRKLEEGGLANYERDTLSCVLAALELQPGAVFFDVGANIGVFSFVAAALTDARVVAFEPTPDIVAVARSVAQRNELHYEVETLALGATEGTATFYLSDVTDSSNSLRKGFRPSHRSITVSVETLDGYGARTGVLPSVVKLDTEATEPDILRGARMLLEHRRPWIVCEVLAGRTENDLTEVLRGTGYRWYQITDQTPLIERSRIEGDPTYAYTNWLFSPERPGDGFWRALDRWRDALARCHPAGSSQPLSLGAPRPSAR